MNPTMSYLLLLLKHQLNMKKIQMYCFDRLC